MLENRIIRKKIAENIIFFVKPLDIYFKIKYIIFTHRRYTLLFYSQAALSPPFRAAFFLSDKESIMQKIKAFFHQQNLRRRAARLAGRIEIVLSFAMLIGILILSIEIFFDIKEMVYAFIYSNKIPSFSEFLSLIFSLVIGLEFVNMLIKHTPGSALEVVLYTIARKIIADHGSMFDALLGVVAIAVLFAVKKYLNEGGEYGTGNECDYIVNGGTSIHEINHRLDSDFDEAYGNTVAGYLFNYLKQQGRSPHLGLEADIGEYKFIIHEMDNDLIRYIKILPINEHKN